MLQNGLLPVKLGSYAQISEMTLRLLIWKVQIKGWIHRISRSVAIFNSETEAVLTIWKAVVSVGSQLFIPSHWMVIYFHKRLLMRNTWLKSSQTTKSFYLWKLQDCENKRIWCCCFHKRVNKDDVIGTKCEQSSQLFSNMKWQSRYLTSILYIYFGVVYNHALPVFCLGNKSYSLNIYVLQSK